MRSEAHSFVDQKAHEKDGPALDGVPGGGKHAGQRRGSGSGPGRAGTGFSRVHSRVSAKPAILKIQLLFEDGESRGNFWQINLHTISSGALDPGCYRDLAPLSRSPDNSCGTGSGRCTARLGHRSVVVSDDETSPWRPDWLFLLSVSLSKPTPRWQPAVPGESASHGRPLVDRHLSSLSKLPA